MIDERADKSSSEHFENPGHRVALRSFNSQDCLLFSYGLVSDEVKTLQDVWGPQ